MADHHSALIYTMVLASAVDGAMTDRELHTIGENVLNLPIFADYDNDHLTKAVSACAAILQKEKGFEQVIREIKAALPPRLRETAYALACDIATCDGEMTAEERRLLEILRDRLVIEGTAAVAFERAARARYMTI